ncbi:RidA family protein [Streptomyces sp. NPDC058052]|uniref:RidA family protein n=1 Tax=Streptomyces sp. NPDC058052 TaxID=3346316 RepID=UPI0036E2BAF3
MTERRSILSGSTFEEQIGYARAVVDGDWVHVSGTTGFDYATMTISEDVGEQAEQCLRNIETALSEAECTLADVVRVRYLLPDRADFEPCWPVLRRAFGQVRPAATMLVCGLADRRMKIEIEAYARRPAASPPRGRIRGGDRADVTGA